MKPFVGAHRRKNHADLEVQKCLGKQILRLLQQFISTITIFSYFANMDH